MHVLKKIRSDTWDEGNHMTRFYEKVVECWCEDGWVECRYCAGEGCEKCAWVGEVECEDCGGKGKMLLWV